MSAQKLRAIVWLRWRLTRNVWAKRGPLGAVLAVLFGIGALGLAVVGFGGGIAAGMLALHGASPTIVMSTWLGVAGVFCFSWTIAVLVDLQRSEVIDIPRLMHLPIGLGLAFAVNYVASLLGAVMAFSVPGMIGLTLGLALDRGPAMLLLGPLAIGLVFMVTAWTYLFQGWIATWVQSPRRRRALVTAVALVVVLLGQLPNLLVNVLSRVGPGENADPAQEAQTFACGSASCGAEQACAVPCCGQTFRWKHEYAPALDFMPRDESVCGACTKANHAGAGAPANPRPTCVDAQPTIKVARHRHAQEQQMERLSVALIAAEKFVPPLWLSAGARGLAEGNPLAALLGTLGFAALGFFAMLRGYRSTLRFYAGGDGASSAVASPVRQTVAAAPRTRQLVERSIVGASGQTAAIAVASLRSMLRAPEVLMSMGVSLVLIPVLLGVSALKHRGSLDVAAHFRPLVMVAAMLFANLTLSQMLNNQFGHDRDAFRALLLAPVPRRRILLGKNLAMLLLALPSSTLVLAAGALWLHLPPLAALATVPQLSILLLVVGMAGNLVSILAPYRIEPGSMKATKLPPGALLGVFGALFALPLLSLPALAGPIVVAFSKDAGAASAQIADLAISLTMAALVAGAYAASLGPLAQLLQQRETVIVGRVTGSRD